MGYSAVTWRLHARSVALAAGAPGHQVETVAAMIVEARNITLEGAQSALRVLAGAKGPCSEVEAEGSPVA